MTTLPALPDTCPSCGAARSHDVRNLVTLALLGRVYKCGAALSTNAAGGWFTAIVCRRAGEVIDALRAENARLRADNVRIGDRGVLTTIAVLAAVEALEDALTAWVGVPLEALPSVSLLRLAPIRAAYDELVDALEGAAPAAAAPANETCPGQSEGVTAAEHVGDPARSS